MGSNLGDSPAFANVNTLPVNPEITQILRAIRTSRHCGVAYPAVVPCTYLYWGGPDVGARENVIRPPKPLAVAPELQSFRVQGAAFAWRANVAAKQCSRRLRMLRAVPFSRLQPLPAWRDVLRKATVPRTTM